MHSIDLSWLDEPQETEHYTDQVDRQSSDVLRYLREHADQALTTTEIREATGTENVSGCIDILRRAGEPILGKQPAFGRKGLPRRSGVQQYMFCSGVTASAETKVFGLTLVRSNWRDTTSVHADTCYTGSGGSLTASEATELARQIGELVDAFLASKRPVASEPDWLDQLLAIGGK